VIESPFVVGFGATAASVTEGSGVGSVLDLEIVSGFECSNVGKLTCTFCAFFLALLSWFFVGFDPAEAMMCYDGGLGEAGDRTEREQRNENYDPLVRKEVMADVVVAVMQRLGEGVHGQIAAESSLENQY
jgi:hypothetical protein